ncbi:MAG: hydroxymethylglutaryl-CoA lyase [Planctomycetes bacterium]|nr:hydroxymethylglutaryl-CoA lyase [Planctomycetota bacterium]
MEIKQSPPNPSVTVVEVGPRDGLQNESEWVGTADKLRFIELLAAAGFRRIEAAAFVHPRWMPQMRDAGVLWPRLPARLGLAFSALVPNEKGMRDAVAAGVRHVAVVTAASETFNRRNLNAGTRETLDRIRAILAMARPEGIPVRGYISTSFTCPYEGTIPPDRVAELAENLLAQGCFEVAISDTLGVATAEDVSRVLEAVIPRAGVERLALHLHDTYGRALACVGRGLECGVRTFDASAGGLGGCPFAPGAPGNLATGRLLRFLEEQGMPTGISGDAVSAAADFIRKVLRH